MKEGQDVLSVNYCGGNRNNPYVGFLSKREPLHGTGIEKSGRTYRVSCLFLRDGVIDWIFGVMAHPLT